MTSARAASGHAEADDNLLQLVVQLTNTTSQPLAVSPSLFRVMTRAGLLVSPTPAARLRWVTASAPSTSVELAPGAVLPGIGLAFAVPAGDAVSLEYRGAVVSATAPISVEACASCNGSCTYLDVEADRCCDGEKPVGGSCVNHVAVCPDGLTACGASPRTCVNLASDSRHCGACGNPAPTGGTCRQGVAGCFSSEARCSNAGGAWCANLARSVTDCGACGHSCAALGIQALDALGEACILGDCDLCVASRCDGWLNNWDRTSCTQYCRSKGLECADSNGFSCTASQFSPGRGACGGTSGTDYDHTHLPGGGGKGTWWLGVSCNTVPPAGDDHFRCHCVQ